MTVKRSVVAVVVTSLALAFLGPAYWVVSHLSSAPRDRLGERIEEAGTSGDPQLIRDLVTLLETRLRDPEAVSLDHTLEALISLMRAGESERADTVARVAREDPNEDVRYVALEVSTRLDPQGSQELIEERARDDDSRIVRQLAAELIVSRGPTSAKH